MYTIESALILLSCAVITQQDYCIPNILRPQVREEIDYVKGTAVPTAAARCYL